MQYWFCFSVLVTGVNSQRLLLALPTRTVYISQSGAPGGNSSSYWVYLFQLCLKNRHKITASLCTHGAYCEKTLAKLNYFLISFLTPHWQMKYSDVLDHQELGCTRVYLIIFRRFSFPPSLFTRLLCPGKWEAMKKDLWCIVEVWQDFP